MSLRMYRSKRALGKVSLKAGTVTCRDARKDLAMAKHIKMGIDPVFVNRYGKVEKIKVDPKIVALADELQRTAGTPKGAALRGKLLRVIADAKKDMASKARGRW